ncbi:MAG: acetyl-CoA carboxylase biotin carboxyl carrier protein [Defluviitaleaceae bacterium]|nr:acetyl-CoA carboxylase biotin carboxyl carrier protein [Defluviitaleaceae bacterium]
MTYVQIRELLEYIENSSFTSASVGMGNVHVSASKNANDGYYPPMSYAPMATAPVQFAPQATQAAEADETSAPAKPKIKFADPDETTNRISGHIITSPIVGTFYASPNPDSPALAPVGKAVKKGDVLCILEAMKIMNEITSDVDGTVAQVMVENGDMVEALQPLFRIEV